jgi:soluble P-type ATPase
MTKYQKTAIYNNYIIAQVEGGTDLSRPIRLFKDTSFVARGDVKGELRKIASKINVNINTSEGKEKTTQQLGNNIINELA